MSQNTFEDLIRQYVTLSSHVSTKGWWTCKCAVCNDYKSRGGFKFESPSISYHCFNCGKAATYNPIIYKNISKDMKEILDSFFIPENEYQSIVFNNLVNFHNTNKPTKQKLIPVDPDTSLVEIEFPEQFVKLSESNDSWAQYATEYLISRHIDPTSYPFFVLEKTKQIEAIEKKWRGRLIIPYYRTGKLVWYQGRDLRQSSKMRYINATTSSECILSNYDALWQNVNTPLFIFEGFFDAHLVDGVAIFGNEFKKGQLKLLQKSKRRKVYVPDRSKDGINVAKYALQLGWEVSIPDIGSCKDINAAVSRYGKLYTIKTLYDNICSGLKAQVQVNSL